MAITDEVKILETKITTQDVDAVRMLSNGKTVSQIAEDLGLNRRTLEARLDRLRKSLSCDTGAQLACFFLRNKLID